MSSRTLPALAMAILLGACGGGSGRSDDLLDRMIAAVTPAGKVVFLEGREFPEDQEEGARRISIWIDGDKDATRYERVLEWPGGSTRSVRVGDGWKWVEYDEEANSVHERDIPGEGRGRFRDPSVFALTYLWLLTNADGWIEEERSEGGRDVILVESSIVQQGDGGDYSAGTEFISLVTLDKETLWPRHHETWTVEPGAEQEPQVWITEFDTTRLLDREELPDDLFSLEAVREAVKTLDEKIAEATSLDFTLFWLGQEHAESGLSLDDIRVTTSPGERAMLSYGTDDFPDFLVMMWEEEGDRPSRTNCDMAGSDVEPVSVAGADGTLMTTPYDAHCLWLSKGGTAIVINTVRAGRDGKDVNPFNNRNALISLAEALVPAE